MNKRISLILYQLFLCFSLLFAQSAVNDNNTPLHLMKPAYRVGYGIPTVDEVKQVMDRVLNYIDQETPAVLVDKRSG